MNKNIFWLYAMSAVLFFGRGIEELPGTSVFFYFKETLHLSAQTIMYLSSLVTLAWLIKPLIGYMIDRSTVGKKWWIAGAISVSSLIATFMGLLPVLALPLIIGCMMLSSWNSAVCNVAVDGEMCVAGKAQGLTGKIQSVQWVSITLASVLVGVCGGFLAEHFKYQVSYLALLPLYALMFTITLQYRQSEHLVVQRTNFWSTLKTMIQNKELMLICLFLFLYNFSPSFGTPLTFIERDQWHWSKLWIGTLGTIGAIASVFGCWLYWKFAKKIDINKWLFYSVFIGAVNTLCFLYFTPVTCVIYDVVNSLIGMFLQLIVLDYMARKSTPGMESMSFALLCSVSNLTGTMNGLAGGYLFPIIGLKWLIILSATTSFMCLPLLKRIRV